jgi:hypothetical protein
MTDKTEDLTLEHLRVLRSESKQNREDMRDLTHHVIVIRNQMADFLKENATCMSALPNMKRVWRTSKKDWA